MDRLMNCSALDSIKLNEKRNFVSVRIVEISSWRRVPREENVAVESTREQNMLNRIEELLAPNFFKFLKHDWLKKAHVEKKTEVERFPKNEKLVRSTA